MSEYDELMARRAKLVQVWMDCFVKPAKERGMKPEDMYSTGVMLTSKGTLVMTVRVREGLDFELRMATGDEKVTCENSDGYEWEPEA